MALHIVMFPFLALGHTHAFLELSKALAERGHHISFVSTPRNIKRLSKLPPSLTSLITFVALKLPQVKHLPHDAEATSDISVDKVPYLKIAFDGLASSLTTFLESSSPPPDWIIHDFAPHWLPPIAAKLNIPCAFFSVFNAATNRGFFGSMSSSVSSEDLGFRKFEVARLVENACVENESGVSDEFRFHTAFKDCNMLAIRSCPEFELDSLNLIREKLGGKMVIPVGLLPPQLGSKEEDGWVEIKECLDKQEANSVVYVAFGNEVAMSQLQVAELAFGLELSGLPFFWVLKCPAGSTEHDALPIGFEDRVKGRGVVWKSWVPQIRILNHASIGGSLMHSGWSSVIETLAFGLPLVLLPMINDQPIIARVLEMMKIGLQVPRNDEDGSFARESVADSLRRVMVEKEGEHYKSIAKELKKLFGDKTLHDKYVDDFITSLREYSQKRSSTPQV